KIKHIGFSFHDSADVLGRILNEHPEVEAVQIVVNYMDWDARFIQARECYETIRRNGCEVLIMEPVKGGLLANPPAEADKLLKESAKDCSAASWALRFAGGLEGVRAVISGMSNLAQVRDNIATMNNFAPLTEEERTLLKKAVRAYEAAGPLGDMDLAPFEEINPKGISAAAILETWNHCMIQPVPTFAAEQNYFSTEKAKHKIRMDEPCMPENIVFRDGRDVTELVKGAEKFLTDTAFFKYEI
ncbi:MAG: aldo/keto reductase, partial [Selenomonadaceae bacterium]|nr:aldo/keto reductase [Selenomonadaceae bacterium]